jgi:HlyD family secretion protein
VLVLENRRLVERKFQPGLSNWRHTEVREGLRAGEQVVTSLEREGVKAGVGAIAE